MREVMGKSCWLLRKDLEDGAFWITFRTAEEELQETGRLTNVWGNNDVVLEGHELVILANLRIPLVRVERIECFDADYPVVGVESVTWVWARKSGKLRRLATTS